MTTIITGNAPQVQVENFKISVGNETLRLAGAAQGYPLLRKQYSVPPEATVQEYPVEQFDMTDLYFRWYKVTL